MWENCVVIEGETKGTLFSGNRSQSFFCWSFFNFLIGSALKNDNPKNKKKKMWYLKEEKFLDLCFLGFFKLTLVSKNHRHGFERVQNCYCIFDLLCKKQ